jgi:hypothetical protein
MRLQVLLRAIAIPCAILSASCSVPSRDEARLLDELEAVRASLTDAAVFADPPSAEGAEPVAAPETPDFDLVAMPPPAFGGLEPHRAPAQDSEAGAARDWSLQFGAGFTVDPDMLLLPLTLERRIAEGLYIGPSLQVGLSDSHTFIAPTVELRWAFLQGIGDSGVVETLIPFVTAGAGAAYLEKSQRSGDDDEWKLMVDAGAGIDLALGDTISLGSRVVLDWFPDELLDEDFLFTWQVLTLRIRF